MLSKNQYIPKKPCYRGHKLRYIQNKSCVSCVRITVEQWNKRYPGRYKAYRKERYLNVKSQQSVQMRAHYQKTKKKRAAQILAYCKANPGRMAARNMRRVTLKHKATPLWLSIEQIAEMLSFYLLAERKTRKTGIQYHVDHWVPLNNPTVCGLHVPWNLQVLSAKKNLRKGNKFSEAFSFRGKKVTRYCK